MENSESSWTDEPLMLPFEGESYDAFNERIRAHFVGDPVGEIAMRRRIVSALFPDFGTLRRYLDAR